MTPRTIFRHTVAEQNSQKTCFQTLTRDLSRAARRLWWSMVPQIERRGRQPISDSDQWCPTSLCKPNFDLLNSHLDLSLSESDRLRSKYTIENAQEIVNIARTSEHQEKVRKHIMKENLRPLGLQTEPG